MTAECDKCGLVKRDVRVVEYRDGLRMMCATCAPGTMDSPPDAADDDEEAEGQLP
jgi:hypothetical protein